MPTSMVHVTSPDFELIPPEAIVAAAHVIAKAMPSDPGPAELATLAAQAMRPVLREHLLVLRVLAALSVDLFSTNCRKSEVVDRVVATLDEIEQGDHATAGRDYGRGMAEAVRLVRTALAG